MCDFDKLVEQLEFYFSHSNYRSDNFLRNLSQLNNGWFNASVLLSFNKIKEMDAQILDIQNACKKIKTIEIKEIEKEEIEEEKKENADSNKKVDDFLIKRNVEVGIDYLMDKDLDKRTLYIYGLPFNWEMKEILQFFEPFFKYSKIKMARRSDKGFKGYVIVEFDTVEECERVKTLCIVAPKDDTIHNKENKNNNLPIVNSDQNEGNDSDKPLVEEIKTNELEEDAKTVSSGDLETSAQNKDSNGSDEVVKRSKISSDDSNASGMKVSNDSTVNITTLPSYLEIKTREEFVLFNNKKQNVNSGVKKIKDQLVGKFYLYDCDLPIKTIKDIVDGAAFVDTHKKVLRFKSKMDFSEKSYKKENDKINLVKMSDVDEAEYIKNLTINIKKTRSKPRKNKR